MTESEMSSPVPEYETVVADALARLNEDERELIFQMYFLGRTYEEIAKRSGRLSHRLVTVHSGAMRKLRYALGPYVERRFGLPHARPKCPICNSPYCREIEQIIADRDRSLTWKPVLAALRERFGLDCQKPQPLMSHERFHMIWLPHQTENGDTR